MRGSIENRIRARFEEVGVPLGAAEADQLAAYLGLLTKWNKKVNLTALDLEKLDSDALDRLLVEPVSAARLVAVPASKSNQISLLDVGSGGGSPAIPLRIALGAGAHLVMVESRGRKAAFLREAARSMDLKNADVFNGRLEEFAADVVRHGTFDLVSIRAVRADAELWRSVASLLKPGGRVLWFRTPGEGESDSELAPLGIQRVETLPTGSAAEVAILLRR